MISCRPISQSNNVITYTFKLATNERSTVNRIPRVNDYDNANYLIIEHEDVFRLVYIKSFDRITRDITVSCFDPPFPASTSHASSSLELLNLNILTDQFRARFIDEPQKLSNGSVHLTSQQFIDVQNIWEEE